MSHTSIDTSRLSELNLGIIGFPGSGKTVFHAGAYFSLSQQSLEAPITGELTGAKAIKYVQEITENLKKSKYPAKSQKTQHLTYRVKYRNTGFLINTLDYAGAKLSDLLKDSDKPAVSNSEIKDFLTKCDAFCIFIPADELINSDADAIQTKINKIIKFLTSLQNEKVKPILLCITKSDLLSDLKSKQAETVEKTLNEITASVQKVVKTCEVYRISAVGTEFSKKDKPKSLNPLNVLKPFNYLCENKIRHRNRHNARQAIALISVFLTVFLALSIWLTSHANNKFQNLVQSTQNLDLLTDEDLEIKRFEIEDMYNQLGFYKTFVPDDADMLRTKALLKLNDIQNHRQKITSTETSTTLSEEEIWEQAKAANTTNAYQNYINKFSESGKHIEDAQKRILGLKQAKTLTDWNAIALFIDENPTKYAEITEQLNNFIKTCPFEIRKKISPTPEELLATYTKSWDKSEWKQIMDFEDKNVESSKGSIQNIQILMQKIEKYQTHFAKPINLSKATKILQYYKQVSTAKTYEIILVKGEYKGGIEDYEKNPDMYIKVFVNDALQYESSDLTITDDNNPRWNTHFRITWKAYDKVRVEIWDKNLINDELMCNLTCNDATSAYTVFRHIYYPTRIGWKLRITFKWLGPKRY